MGNEINLMKNYPKTKRDPIARAAKKTGEDRTIARRFDKDFFDGDRKVGYGGFRQVQLAYVSAKNLIVNMSKGIFPKNTL